MSLQLKLDELNKELGSSITTKTVIDKMYQKAVLEFSNEKGEVFFKGMGPEPVLGVSDLEIEVVSKIYDEFNEDWENNTIQALKIRYKELYINN